MYCKNCGKEIADESKFCQYCGTSVEKSTPMSVKWHRLSRLNWIAILSGLVWIAYWAEDSLNYYLSSIEYCRQAALYSIINLDEKNLTIPSSIIQNDAYARSMANFIECAIIPLLIAIIVCIMVPVCYKKYKSWRATRTKSKMTEIT